MTRGDSGTVDAGHRKTVQAARELAAMRLEGRSPCVEMPSRDQCAGADGELEGLRINFGKMATATRRKGRPVAQMYAEPMGFAEPFEEAETLAMDHSGEIVQVDRPSPSSWLHYPPTHPLRSPPPPPFSQPPLHSLHINPPVSPPCLGPGPAEVSRWSPSTTDEGTPPTYFPSFRNSIVSFSRRPSRTPSYVAPTRRPSLAASIGRRSSLAPSVDGDVSARGFGLFRMNKDKPEKPEKKERKEKKGAGSVRKRGPIVIVAAGPIGAGKYASMKEAAASAAGQCGGPGPARKMSNGMVTFERRAPGPRRRSSGSTTGSGSRRGSAAGPRKNSSSGRAGSVSKSSATPTTPLLFPIFEIKPFDSMTPPRLPFAASNFVNPFGPVVPVAQDDGAWVDIDDEALQPPPPPRSPRTPRPLSATSAALLSFVAASPQLTFPLLTDRPFDSSRTTSVLSSPGRLPEGHPANHHARFKTYDAAAAPLHSAFVASARPSSMLRCDDVSQSRLSRTGGSGSSLLPSPVLDHYYRPSIAPFGDQIEVDSFEETRPLAAGNAVERCPGDLKFLGPPSPKDNATSPLELRPHSPTLSFLHTSPDLRLRQGSHASQPPLRLSRHFSFPRSVSHSWSESQDPPTRGHSITSFAPSSSPPADEAHPSAIDMRGGAQGAAAFPLPPMRPNRPLVLPVTTDVSPPSSASSYDTSQLSDGSLSTSLGCFSSAGPWVGNSIWPDSVAPAVDFEVERTGPSTYDRLSPFRRDHPSTTLQKKPSVTFTMEDLFSPETTATTQSTSTQYRAMPHVTTSYSPLEFDAGSHQSPRDPRQDPLPPLPTRPPSTPVLSRPSPASTTPIARALQLAFEDFHFLPSSKASRRKTNSSLISPLNKARLSGLVTLDDLDLGGVRLRSQSSPTPFPRVGNVREEPEPSTTGVLPKRSSRAPAGGSATSSLEANVPAPPAEPSAVRRRTKSEGAKSRPRLLPIVPPLPPLPRLYLRTSTPPVHLLPSRPPPPIPRRPSKERLPFYAEPPLSPPLTPAASPSRQNTSGARGSSRSGTTEKRRRSAVGPDVSAGKGTGKRGFDKVEIRDWLLSARKEGSVTASGDSPTR